MISIVDYGLGNVLAFSNVYKRLNIAARTVSSADQLASSTKIILPGVGAFDHAMERLEASGMRPVLNELVLNKKVPVLGICVGMQMLAKSSDEGRLPGLGWIEGKVCAFKSLEETAGLPLPHMGWNDVHPKAGLKLFSGLETDARFYFLHSFYFSCERSESVAATTEYGVDFSCAVASNNVYGVQFHPEKSHHCGTRLLQNFAEL